MTTSNHKDTTYLILVNFTETSYMALDYLIKLVKMTKGKIEVFCVIDPSKIADNENQINVLRSIQVEEKRISRKLNSIMEMIELEGIKTSSSYVIGNLKVELNLRLIQLKPDVVVLGKGKGTTSEILNYLVNEYKKSVLILGEKSQFMKGTEIAIGYNPNTFDKFTSHLVSTFSQRSNIPLTLLTVTDLPEDDYMKSLSRPISLERNNLHVHLECKNDTNVANALLDKVSKGDVELLCIGRSLYKNSFFQNLFNSTTTFKIAQKIKTPLFIMEVIQSKTTS